MENTSLHKLFNSVKRYLGLQRDFVLLSVAEKVTVIMAAFILIMVLLIIMLVASVFFMLALGVWLGELLDCAALGYLIAGAVYALTGLLVYCHRTRWIADPIAKFVGKQLLEHMDEEDDDDDESVDDDND